MGSMAGAFTYVSLPLYRLKSLESLLRLAGGIAWVQKPYNENTNHKNVLIGSPFNGYINILWQHTWQLTAATAVTAGASFSHLSNGGITLPNLGLNIPAVVVGVQHGLAAATKTITADKAAVSGKRFLKTFTISLL